MPYGGHKITRIFLQQIDSQQNQYPFVPMKSLQVPDNHTCATTL